MPIIGKLFYYTILLGSLYGSLILSMIQYHYRGYYYAQFLIFALCITFIAFIARRILDPGNNLFPQKLEEEIDNIKIFKVVSMKDIIRQWVMITAILASFAFYSSICSWFPPIIESTDEVHFANGKILTGDIIGANSNYLFFNTNEDNDIMIILKNDISFVIENKKRHYY